ncbi:MAG TPA: hypothetical protein VE153_00475, partial [Myxococcus sp.]|nr:hypothetical protein [Myxococcus sp.]
MIRSFRLIRVAVLGLSLAWTAPSFAQSFEGLDLAGQSKKKKRGGTSKKTKKPTRKGKAAAAKPDEAEAEDPTAATPSAATPEAVSAPAAAGKPAPTPTPATPPADGFGLDLTQESPKPAAPTMSFEAVDVSGKTADRQRLDVAVSLFKNDEYEKAAMSAHELLGDAKLAGLHTEARYVLAKSLYRMGMYHSSLGEFSKLLSLGPSTKFFKTSLEWLFFISRKTKNETVILDEIARHANQEFPEKYRNEFRYLLARYHFV